MAKRIAGMVAKESRAESRFPKKNEGLGFAYLGVAMHASDRADLRQWSTLPETVQAAHLCTFQKVNISIQMLGVLTADGSPSSEVSPKSSKWK